MEISNLEHNGKFNVLCNVCVCCVHVFACCLCVCVCVCVCVLFVYCVCACTYVVTYWNNSIITLMSNIGSQASHYADVQNHGHRQKCHTIKRNQNVPIVPGAKDISTIPQNLRYIGELLCSPSTIVWIIIGL